MPSRALRSVLAFATLVVVPTACDVATPSRGTYEHLANQSEADLVYPDSELLSDGGYDAELTIDGPQPAGVWKIYGSNAAIEDIRAYYEAQLAERGWRQVPGSRSTTELDAWSWIRGDLGFRLGIKDPDDWHERLAGSDRFGTLYEVRLADGQSGRFEQSSSEPRDTR